MWQNPHARKGEAQGVLSYQKVKGIFDNPHMGIHMNPYGSKKDQRKLPKNSELNCLEVKAENLCLILTLSRDDFVVWALHVDF